MRFARKAAALGALTALAVGTTTAFASTASAAPAAAQAVYGNQCGSGYKVVNSAPVGSLGTIFLTYNSSSGKNCVTTIRNTTGDSLEMSAWLYVQDTDEYDEDFGWYTKYAGPVYGYGKGHCVNWGGQIANVYVTVANTNCGSLKEARVTEVR